jgi:hypothetical protein
VRVSRPAKLLLGLLYYVVFVSVAAIMRIFRDPLERAWDERKESYFERHEPW